MCSRFFGEHAVHNHYRKAGLARREGAEPQTRCRSSSRLPTRRERSMSALRLGALSASGPLELEGCRRPLAARNHRNAADQAGVHARPVGAHPPDGSSCARQRTGPARTVQQCTPAHRRNPRPHLTSSAPPPRPSQTPSTSRPGHAPAPSACPPRATTHRPDPPTSPANHQRRSGPPATSATTPRHAAERWIEA
jgi:hypothetical protein